MSLFKRLFSIGKEKTKSKHKDHSKYYPSDELSLDKKFTQNFKQNGGKFIYCENQQEILDNFDAILLENDWYEQDVFCVNANLERRFEGFNLNFIKKTTASFFLTSCESLIAIDGSILLSSNQVKEKKINELPSNFVVFATTSQLVNTISEGLHNIKNSSDGHIPSSITTIKDFGSNKEKNFMTYGSSAKNLYLLLLEDL